MPFLMMAVRFMQFCCARKKICLRYRQSGRYRKLNDTRKKNQYYVLVDSLHYWSECWIYDGDGEFIDLLHNTHSVLTSSSVLGSYSKGDIIEILIPDSTLQLGIILEVPSYSPTDSAGKNSHANKYTILIGPYYDDIWRCDVSQIRHYKGVDRDVDFMRDYYSNLPDNLLAHDE